MKTPVSKIKLTTNKKDLMIKEHIFATLHVFCGAERYFRSW